jgi:hypothetical protein
MDQTTTQQPLQCKVCQKVTMADGSTVWVCQECGAENEVVNTTQPVAAPAPVVAAAAPVVPGVPDNSLQTDVDQAAAQLTPAATNQVK